ncbi:MAG: M16 family metallopeptidase [Roseateles sp.]
MGLFSFLKRDDAAAAAAPKKSAKSGAKASATDDVQLLRVRARRRLIGAAVLVAAGVVGFPLIFETQPRPIPVDLPIEIPRKETAPPLAVPTREPLPPARPIAARTVLVDKPGAPQTALAVVAPGPFAAAPDAPALKVMNAALGGLFTSRINHQLREVKGYTYGVFSSFSLGRERGQFTLQGSVRTDVTGAALADLWKEITAMRSKPMGAAELGRVRNAVLLSLPGQFDTNGAVVAGYAGNWAAGRPLSAITELPGRYAAVTAADALQAAKQHLDPRQLTVVAVGDRAKVQPQLQKLGRKPELLTWE